MAPYHLAPTGWEPSHPNPFTPDGSYGCQWDCYHLLDRDDESFFTGRQSNGLFLAQAGQGIADLAYHLADFIRYECRYGRQVIVAALFTHAERQMREAGHRLLILHCATHTAKPFYLAMGCTVTEIRPCANGPLQGCPITCYQKEPIEENS